MAKTRRNREKLPEIHNAKEIYLRLFRYAWKYKYVFMTSIFALVVLSVSNTGFLALIKEVTD
ncbi:MAG: hypothetical protein B7X97_07205, partial [Methylotenera sp. 17-45-7]